MHIHKIADSEYHLYCVCSPIFVLSACLLGTVWLPLAESLLNMIFEVFKKMC
jgi:hypothetical protein